MKITIKEVAKEANVSKATVSRVLSESPDVSAKTRTKVTEVINKLKFKPNTIARSLVSKKSRILGIVCTSESRDLLTNSFFLEVMEGMSLYAQSKKYYITYAFNKDKIMELGHIKEVVSSNLVDGICLLRATEDDKSIKYLKKVQFPFVVIDRIQDRNDEHNINAVGLGYYAAKTLIEFLEKNKN
ncbi:MAG: LacI family transcriptional regulator [Clostridium beijerinckii]|nr:LacI family transcriptional regulator [Clostridium beijerinckii]MCI1578270.1 LacI family transcriptional regulator [Clostridium beijerinckii]MCI1583806.1 LacI family transcriptional regulator [Clostridium beijerinckii]MCI1621469.1 LacI family transcriptional regulator [Clostridium beijerinckii]